MAEKRYVENCPVGTTFMLLGGKWKILILFSLMKGTKRFNELRRNIPEVTQRMLTTQLRELEEDKIIIRKVYAEVPPKVEYSLTEIGEALIPTFNQLKNWGNYYLKKRQEMDSSSSGE